MPKYYTNLDELEVKLKEFSFRVTKEECLDLLRGAGFKNILISDDISMKSLKGKIKENTINAFNAGCNLVLHCNAKENEMEIVAQNSPFISKFVIKKTSQFYKIIS